MSYFLENTPRQLLHVFVFLLAIVTIQACGDDDDDPVSPGNGDDEDSNIAEVAQSEDNYSTLVSNLEDADLLSTLEEEGPFTVFAPTNDAFDNLPEGLLDDLSSDELAEILNYHIVESQIASEDLDSAQTVETAADDELFVTVNGDVVVNDSATVTSADIGASNGVIHEVDAVLLPDTYVDITGIVAKRYNLQSLEDAVTTAGLDSTLQEEGPYTLFAPTNEAIDSAEVSELSEEELQDVLTYHVLPEEVLSGDISSGTYTTVNGEDIEVEADGEGNVDLTDQAGNMYMVTTADLQGSNGVVHIIDGVLIPEESTE